MVGIVVVTLLLIATPVAWRVTHGNLGLFNPGSAEILVPPRGQMYYGVQLDWEEDSPATYSARLGHSPAIYGTYLEFPFDQAIKRSLHQKVDQVAAMKADLMLTLMPNRGLDTVTADAVHDLASTVARHNELGVGLIVRFGHEMNGSWYAWCQQPAAYIDAFRRVANAIHTTAPDAIMLWAPNYGGGGWPFDGGRYRARRGTADYQELDSDGDGHLTKNDDPYAPFYPGDRYVDWVGLTLYHWGSRYPWTENELPERNKFAASLTGTYNGKGGDERSVPNFYERYAMRHNKPMVVAETSALYRPSAKRGPSDLAIKSAWWDQVFAPFLSARFPRLIGVLWFEYDKVDEGAVAHWRATIPSLVREFEDALPSNLVFSG
jgi:hypothetical protein